MGITIQLFCSLDSSQLYSLCRFYNEPHFSNFLHPLLSSLLEAIFFELYPNSPSQIGDDFSYFLSFFQDFFIKFPLEITSQFY